jgi:hypothetical protein
MGKVSYVWKYFTRVDNKRAKCNNCNIKLILSHYNMKTHLKRAHAIGRNELETEMLVKNRRIHNLNSLNKENTEKKDKNDRNDSLQRPILIKTELAEQTHNTESIQPFLTESNSVSIESLSSINVSVPTTIDLDDRLVLNDSRNKAKRQRVNCSTESCSPMPSSFHNHMKKTTTVAAAAAAAAENTANGGTESIICHCIIDGKLYYRAKRRGFNE